jgi:hypothetical protein
LSFKKDFFFSDSQILDSNHEVSFLIREIPDLALSTKISLLYRASRDGWMHADFHNLCDKQGPTVVLIKTKKGRICGGFTKASWTSPVNGNYQFDAAAFIFSIDLRAKFIPINNSKAVYHRQSNGPSFGGGVLELRFQPMNKENAGGCLIDGQESFGQYRIPADSEGNSMLTSEGRWTGKNFTCIECEVYEI